MNISHNMNSNSGERNAASRQRRTISGELSFSLQRSANRLAEELSAC